MKGRTTLVFLGILVLLSSFVYFVEIKGKAKRERIKEQSQKILRFSEEEIQSLTLCRSADTLVFERDGENWRISAPIQSQADRYAVKNFVSELAKAKSEREIGGVSDWSQYGLANPPFTVWVQSKSGAMDTLFIGDQSPTYTYRYIKKPGKNVVLCTPTPIGAHLSKSLYDFRDRTVLPFEKETVRRIEIQYEGKSIVLDKVKDAWELISPIKAKADRYKLDELLNKLKWAEAKAFVDENPKRLDSYGLDPPRITIQLVTGPGQIQKRLLIGKKMQGKNMFYAKDESRLPVFTVDSSFVVGFKKDPMELRDKKVCEFDEQSVYYAEIRSKGEDPIICEKDTAGQWHIKKPIEEKAKSWKVTGLFYDLSGLQAEEFIGKISSGLSRYGLDFPQKEVILKTRNNTVIAHVYVGNRTGKDLVFVKNHLTGWVYKTKDRIIQDLSPNLEDWVERENQTTQASKNKKK